MEDKISTPLLHLRKDTGIKFNNKLVYSDSINPYTYRNFYNGSGLAIGDLDNDGLEDIFFTGNQVDNVIYKNKGGLKFEDVTENSGLSCSNNWCTGTSMVDINGDNLLDIYVCKAGPSGGPNRQNQLFINQGNFKFVDQAAQYGLDIEGLSIHASFFDYDRDGDLDCYLLNNSLKSIGGYDLREGQRNTPSTNGNKLLENVGGKFIDKTTELGIYSSDIGFGLGVMIVDINGDHYPDIYVANDFFEKDYLYINQQGEKFIEQGEKYFPSFSLGSMGVNAADINNDLKPDIFVAEMLPSTLVRQKTKAIFDTWEKYQNTYKKGYYNQYPRNMLFMNGFPHKFEDRGRMYDCDATEWSWAPLIFDMDNDGFKDIFVSNGVGRDLLDRDYLAFMADDQEVARLIRQDDNALSELIDLMPKSKVQNAIFRNNFTQGFENVSASWTDMPASVSNASAYSDLDKDGDLDLVVANVNDEAFILENTLGNHNNWVGFELVGNEDNSHALGSSIIVYSGDQSFHVDNMPYRGFQSTVSSILNVGLGNNETVDSILINWPNGLSSLHTEVEINKYHQHSLEKSKARESKKFSNSNYTIALEIIDSITVSYTQSIQNDFNKDPLCISMLPKTGPVYSLANFDNDSTEDIFLGGDKDVSSRLILNKGASKEIQTKKRYSAVVGLYHHDFDNDGDEDIYIAHGSRMFSPYSTELDDLILINDGHGTFSVLEDGLRFPKPIITSKVAFGDLDDNGFIDFVLGERLANNVYGQAGSVFVYLNQGENSFKLVQSKSLSKLGMISDIEIGDIDKNGDLEIVIAGEWMGIKIFKFADGDIENTTDQFGLDHTNGMWNIIDLTDLDDDGDLDIIGGNAGLNGFYHTDHSLTVKDFDANGKPEQIVTDVLDKEYYPIHDLDDLSKQLPGIRKKYNDYASYAKANLNDIFGDIKLEQTGLDVTASTVFFFDQGVYVQRDLPEAAQISSIHAVATIDLNQDGVKDILIGGNHYNFKPQYGRDDASSGCLILGSIEEGDYVYKTTHTLGIEGEIRDFRPLTDSTIMIGLVDKDLYTYKISIDDK